MTEQIKSPTTGKTACDFLRDAFAQIALDTAEVARQMHVSSVNVHKWRADASVPRFGHLEQLGEISGIPLETYLPEAVRGKVLLQNAQAWPEGFDWQKIGRRRNGISLERLKKARRGVFASEKCSTNALIRFALYYDEWSNQRAQMRTEDAIESVNKRYISKPGEGESEKEAVYTPETAARRERFKPSSAAKEAEYVRDLFGEIMGERVADQYDLHPIAPLVWQFETAKFYRGEIDLWNMELRVYFKPKNALSIRRAL